MKAVEHHAPKLNFLPVPNLDVRERGIVREQQGCLAWPFAELLGDKIGSDTNHYYVTIEWLHGLAHNHHVAIPDT
jgi:hypothetical protein